MQKRIIGLDFSQKYVLEYVLAKNLVSILEYNVRSGNIEDYAEAYVLYNSYKNKVDYDFLRDMVLVYANEKDIIENAKDWRGYLQIIREEPGLYLAWDKYKQENLDMSNVEFYLILDTIEEIFTNLYI